jgi:hypothetical protein
MKNRTDELREISGKIAYADPLTSFFYQIIRDELPAGTVEKIVQQVIEEPADGCLFINGWLAQYARNLAETLLNAHNDGLKKELEQVFTDSTLKGAFDVAVPPNIKVPGLGDTSLQSEDIAQLEKEVIAACEQNGITSEAVSNFDEAKDMIETQKASGLMTEEEAATALKELAEVEAQGVPRTDSPEEVEKLVPAVTPELLDKWNKAAEEVGMNIVLGTAPFTPSMQNKDLVKDITDALHETNPCGPIDTYPDSPVEMDNKSDSGQELRANIELNDDLLKAIFSAKDGEEKYAAILHYRNLSNDEDKESILRVLEMVAEKKQVPSTTLQDFDFAGIDELVGTPEVKGDKQELDEKDVVFIEDPKTNPEIQKMLREKAEADRKSYEEYMAARQVFGPNGVELKDDVSDPTHATVLPASETVTVRKDVLMQMIDALAGPSKDIMTAIVPLKTEVLKGADEEDAKLLEAVLSAKNKEEYAAAIEQYRKQVVMIKE